MSSNNIFCRRSLLTNNTAGAVNFSCSKVDLNTCRETFVNLTDSHFHIKQTQDVNWPWFVSPCPQKLENYCHLSDYIYTYIMMAFLFDNPTLFPIFIRFSFPFVKLKKHEMQIVFVPRIFKGRSRVPQKKANLSNFIYL